MKSKYLLILLATLFIFSNCTDIFEEELDTKKVVLKSPQNAAVLEDGTVNFWWAYLEGADFYNLQIVSPSFENIEQLILDIDIEDEFQYEMTLDSGTYEWAVIAHNGNSQTLLNARSFIIADTTATAPTFDLSNTAPQLIYPEDGALLNVDSISLLWEFVQYATDYEVQLASPNFTNSTYFWIDQNTTADFAGSAIGEGTYLWRVKATNNFSESAYSTRSFTIDQTAPNTPNILSPQSGDSLVADTINLSWQIIEDASLYHLEIYTDSLLETSYWNAIIPETQEELINIPEHKYYWRIAAQDEAGNWSNYSPIHTFIKIEE